MNKLCRFLILIFLMMPVVFADITITTSQNTYNLGNKIAASASTQLNNGLEGFFKLTLSCGTYSLQYFLTPVSLESNFRTAVNVPDLTATPSMLGNCSIKGSLVTNDNVLVEEKYSNSFSVQNILTILPVKNKITALPGDSLPITGVVNEAFGSNVLKASVKTTLDNASYNVDAVDGKFNLTFGVSKNIKSGKHTIEISAFDAKGNSGQSSIGLEITAIPSYIKTDLSRNYLDPGSKIEIVSALYDQADELINASLNLELKSLTGNKIFTKTADSSEKIVYEFSQFAEPGLYLLASTYNSLLSQSSINVSTIREVKITYSNETVVIENIGNVLFEDELTFILNTEQKKYPITKKVKISPGQAINFDLSKEVPLGVYDIIIPLKEGIEPIKEKINATLQNVVKATQESLGAILPPNASVLASEVTIHDNRPVYKKIASSLSLIKGSLVGTDGLLAKNPLLAPLILIVILLLIVVRYGRKPIMKLIRGRKPDNGKDEED